MERIAIVRNATASLSWSRITVIALVAAAAITILVLAYLRPSSSAPVQDPPLQHQAPSAAPVASMRYLPSEVQLALVSPCGGCTFADSNSAWNSTDVADDRLPRRRLTKTEKRGPTWFIEYEHGGIATFHYTVVLSATSQPRLLQGSSCLPESAQACKW